MMRSIGREEMLILENMDNEILPFLNNDYYMMIDQGYQQQRNTGKCSFSLLNPQMIISLNLYPEEPVYRISEIPFFMITPPIPI
jgi:hypothetical protein